MYLSPEADGGMRTSVKRQSYGLFWWGMRSWLWTRLTMLRFNNLLTYTIFCNKHLLSHSMLFSTHLRILEILLLL